MERHFRFLLLLVALGLHSASGARRGLCAPQQLKYSIEGDHVLVKWKPCHTKVPIRGYYVSVQEKLNKRQLGSPDFVHVEQNTHSAEILGLKPDAVYEIKVITYGRKEHKASLPMIVRTKQLELMMARNLTVSSITATSAIFQWEHDATNNVHDVQFKVKCSGLRQYTDKNNKLVEESALFEHASFSTSHGRERYYANQLEPNTKYSCQMISIAGTLEGPPYGQVVFTTNPGVPLPPPTPKLHVQDTTFTAELYQTDDRFGAISHYTIFAVPTVKKENDPQGAPFTPVIPLNLLISSAVTSELVDETTDPVPFIVGSYKSNKLPKHITFDGKAMKKSFKPKTHYSIVVAAFSSTKGNENSEALYSFSAPAEPPVFISADMQEEWMEAHDIGPVKKRFTTIVVSTLISVTLLFVLAFSLAFGSHYYKGKKRDAYFFTVSQDPDDSSEDELFSKQQPSKGSPSQSERIALLRLNRQSPLASKDVPEQGDNMCHNPAFEEMVYHSPEATNKVTQKSKAERHTASLQINDTDVEELTPLLATSPQLGHLPKTSLKSSLQQSDVKAVTVHNPGSPSTPISPLEGHSIVTYAIPQRKNS